MRKVLSDYIKSQEDFERFCNLFLKKEVSPLVKVYSVPGPDGGIDAEFCGEYAGKSGHWVFQGKFRSFSDTDKARRNIISVMKGDKRKKDKRGELDKANESKCDHYILITNVLLTSGNIGEIKGIQSKKGYTFSLDFWDAEDLITMTDEFPYILNSFREPHLPVFLSYEDMFRDQIKGDHRLLRYDYDTFGRENEINHFRSFVQDTDKRLLVMSGSGGIGKTQLAIEFAKTAEQEYSDYEPLFVQIAEDSFENALADIPPNRKYIFFVDDAHDYLDNLGGIKILLNSSGYSKSKAVLITRKPFKASLRGIFLSALPSQAIGEIEIEKLSFEKTKDFIHKYTQIPGGSLLTDLAKIGRDTPLIAVMVINQFNNGDDVQNLTKDELVKLAFETYLDDIFSKHLPEDDKKHRELLNWLSGIAPIDVENEQISVKLSELLEVKLYEINQYRDTLKNYGLLVQYGRKQRVFPGPLSDYILRKACYLSDGNPSFFHNSLLEKFLPLFPINLIKNLARVEAMAGGKSLLDEYVNDLHFLARTGDNAVRMLILLQMEGICYFRPDDAIEIFNIIIDNPNDHDTEVKIEFWGKFTQTHQSLIAKIVKQARKTVYTVSGYRKTLQIIRKLFLMKDMDYSYGDRPESLLRDMTRFETGKSFVFQEETLEAFEMWKNEDIPELSLALLNVLDSLLMLEFQEVVSQGFSLNISWHTLKYTFKLIQIRSRSIKLIEECLRISSHNIVKLKAVECISKALRPLHSGPGGNNPERLEKADQDLLKEEQARLFEILTNQLSVESDFTVLNAIDECLHVYAENSHGYLKQRATQLLEKFEKQDNYNHYLFYRQFTGKYRQWTTPEEIQKFVEKYIEEYPAIRLAELMSTFLGSSENETNSWAVAQHLWTIGKLNPIYGSELLDYILSWQTDVQDYAAGLLGGIRYSDNDKALEIRQRLLKQDNVSAERIVIKSYLWRTEGQYFDKDDLQILVQFSEIPDERLNSDIVKTLPNFYNVDVETVLEILIRLSTDESSLIKWETIKVLFRFSSQKYLDIYKQVMNNCVNLEHLDYHSEEVLHAIFMFDPIWVIAFFEKRIAYQEKEFKRDITNYEAIPIRLHYLFRDVDWNDKNVMDALRRVRDWGLGLPSHRKWLAPGLLASMVDGNRSQIEGTNINNAVQTILEEWIDSEDSEKMWWAACLLRNFDEDKVFYTLVESLLIKSKGDEKVLTEIEASIGNVGAYSGAFGEPLPHLVKRIEYLKALRDKTESPIVKQFADHLTERTKQEIKREQQMDEEILEGEEW